MDEESGLGQQDQAAGGNAEATAPETQPRQSLRRSVAGGLTTPTCYKNEISGVLMAGIAPLQQKKTPEICF